MSLNPLTGLLIWDQRAVLVVAKLLPRVHRNKWHKSKAVIPVDSWRRRYTHNVVESVSPRVHQYCLVQAGRKIMAIGETGVVRTGVRSLLRFGARPKTSGLERFPIDSDFDVAGNYLSFMDAYQIQYRLYMP